MIRSVSYDAETRKALIRLNRKLGSAGVPHLITEAFIADIQAELITYQSPCNVYYWLLYARMFEAALLCAGNYADNCEYSAAGDLLVNPRCIHVHKIESGTTQAKIRHGSISEQFRPNDVPVAKFRSVFSSTIKLHIAESALLPSMARTLKRSGIFYDSYLVSIDERMKRIADTIAFLSTWFLDSGFELHERLVSVDPESEQFIQSGLCRFSPSMFEALGEELNCIEKNRPFSSALLKSTWHQKLSPMRVETSHSQLIPESACRV